MQKAKEYQEGEDAHDIEINVCDCPYAEGEARAQWLAGWNAAFYRWSGEAKKK